MLLPSCSSGELFLSALTLSSWVHMDSVAHGTEHPMAALLGR